MDCVRFLELESFASRFAMKTKIINYCPISVDVDTKNMYNTQILNKEVFIMTTVSEKIAAYNTATQNLRSGIQHNLPELILTDDGHTVFDTSSVVAELTKMQQNLPIEQQALAADIAVQLHRLQNEIDVLNAKINIENNAIEKQCIDKYTVLTDELYSLPEAKFNRAVVIRNTKLCADYIEILPEVYKNLGLNHYDREDGKDVIYYDENERPHIYKEVVAEFNKVVNDKAMTKCFNFERFVQTEPVQGFLANLVKVIESKKG